MSKKKKARKLNLFLAKTEFLAQKYGVERYVLLVDNGSTISGFNGKQTEILEKGLSKAFKKASKK